MSETMKTPPPCNKDIYDNGTSVFITHSIPSEDIEKWVKKIAKLSGQPVDWHFFGGRAVVLALGDIQKVKDTIKTLLPEHNELQKAEFEKLNIPYKPSYLM